MIEPIEDLEKLCESVYSVVTEKKDDEEENKSPFADTTDSDESDDSADDAGTDDTETDESDDSDESESSDDDSTPPASPFGGVTSDDGDDTEESDDTEDDTDDGMVETETDDGGAASEVSAEGYSDAQNFGITMIMLAAQVHFWHLNCTVGFVHEALQQLYYSLIDLGDKLLENIISKTKAPINAGNELSFDFGTLDYDHEESIGILEDMRDEAESIAKQYGDDEGLVNIVSDISEAFSVAIYKLSRMGE